MPPYDLLVKISNSKDIDEYLQYINTSLVDSKHNIRKPGSIKKTIGD